MDADLPTVFQTELILLAGHFASCTSFEIRDNLKFRNLIRAFCDKAPNIANAIAEVVQKKKYTSIREIPKERTTPRKRRPTQDLSYRPPKYSKLDVQRVDGTKKKMHSPTMPLNDCHHSRPVQNIQTDMPTGKLPESPIPAIKDYPRPRPILGLIIEVTRTLHQLSTHNDGVPRGVHKMILETLNSQSSSAVANIEWSDGSTWVEILEKGASAKVQLTIFNMLEYMGASEWYESQIQLAMRTERTVTRRQVSIGVLDRVHVQQTQRGSRSMSRVGPITMQDESRDQSPNPGFSILAREKKARRKALSNQLSRGHKLSTRIVKELGLGILFSPSIWKYTKMSTEDLDLTIQNIKDDREHMELLAILSPQLQRLVNHGLPDLHSFYADLNGKKLLSESEIQELQKEYILKQDKLPPGKLDMATNILIKSIEEKVLGQQKLNEYDTLAICGSSKISSDIFQLLRPNTWLNSWTIYAAMVISDRPWYVRYGLSVPLYEDGPEKKIRVKDPLAGWVKDIEEDRRKNGNAPNFSESWVYYRPINHGNHFSLLEVNERKRIIRHYDSNASAGIIKGDTKRTWISNLAQKAFGHLGFSYQETPTPQQGDGWSCGIRVIWNFRCLSNDLIVGSWDTILNPEQMLLQVVEGLTDCVENGCIERSRPGGAYR